jgi:hypothetical protein
MSPLIYASVVKLLNQLQTADDTTENQLLRGSAYVTLGTIGKRMPHLLTQTGDLGILEMLFNRISVEPEAGTPALSLLELSHVVKCANCSSIVYAVRGSVQDALKLLVPAFKSLSDALSAKMETLLLAGVERVCELRRHRFSLLCNALLTSLSRAPLTIDRVPGPSRCRAIRYVPRILPSLTHFF